MGMVALRSSRGFSYATSSRGVPAATLCVRDVVRCDTRRTRLTGYAATCCWRAWCPTGGFGGRNVRENKGLIDSKPEFRSVLGRRVPQVPLNYTDRPISRPTLSSAHRWARGFHGGPK